MKPPALPRLIRFGREVCGCLAQAERREWLLTDGYGGYAAGTVAGTLTRCYHGLYTANVAPPLQRRLLAVKAEATLIVDERAYPLSVNRWQSGIVDPSGHLHLESFHLEGRLPVWRYAIGATALEMRLVMDRSSAAMYVLWRLASVPSQAIARLRVDLLVNARDHHAVMAVGGIEPSFESQDEVLRVRFSEEIQLHARLIGGTLRVSPTWVEAFLLPRETERGLADIDNHLRVGTADIPLTPRRWYALALGRHLEPGPRITPRRVLAACRRRDLEILTRALERVPELRTAPPWIHQLVLAADSFLFARPLPGRGHGQSVIAGYPWFGDWGRDTLIALPGLTLATGRLGLARQTLQTYARFVDRGMVPNRLPEVEADAHFNAVDASLWYIEAWRAYYRASGDEEALRSVFPVLTNILQHYRQGTRHGIGMDPADGLLYAGEEGVQLTWMDAKVADWVVTPRVGKAVEVNALWYNALRTMAQLAREVGEPFAEMVTEAERAKTAFGRYRCPSGGLHDVIDGPDGDDASVRPNQLLAVSLPYSPLTADTQRSVVDTCARELLCSYGLRSLAASDPRYRGHYGGDVYARDGAYHQGTVWTWLLGHFALARCRVDGDPAAAQSLLEPLADHLHDAALGTISEIFDGDPPHRPCGAPAQAWSVACTLEAWWRLQRVNNRGQTPFFGEAEV